MPSAANSTFFEKILVIRLYFGSARHIITCWTWSLEFLPCSAHSLLSHLRQWVSYLLPEKLSQQVSKLSLAMPVPEKTSFLPGVRKEPSPLRGLFLAHKMFTPRLPYGWRRFLLPKSAKLPWPFPISSIFQEISPALRKNHSGSTYIFLAFCIYTSNSSRKSRTDSNLTAVCSTCRPYWGSTNPFLPQ